MGHDVAVRSAGQATRIWLQSYPPTVPEHIPPLEHRSLGQLFEESCRRYADRPAFTSMGMSLSYSELELESGKVSAYLQSTGLKKGDRVAVMMPNILQNPVVVYGILRAGLVVVNVNPLYTPRELQHQLLDSGARILFVLENFAHVVQQALPKTNVEQVVVASMGDMLGLKGHVVNFVVRRMKKLVPKWSIPSAISFAKAQDVAAERFFEPADVGPQDIAFLQYTGGTTGVSKGAVLTHGNLLANKQQMSLWLDTAFLRKPRPEQLQFLCALPLYHIFALTVNSLMGIATGGHNILIANPRDIPGFVKDLQKHSVHIFPGLNTLFNALMNNAEFQKLDFSDLILVFGGGMSVQRAVADRWLAMTGCPITEGYGLSETSPVATANRFDEQSFTGMIGLPIPSTEVSIRDEEGHEVELGDVGEICIRGPQVMAGYWNRPDETAAAMTADRYFRTGDMGYMDRQGYIKIVDRKKDMILVSGFNVYPNEIEEVVVLHPGVRECAAIGVADEYSGEAIRLFVVKSDPALTEVDIRNHCKENLTNYKRPRFIEFRDELPKSNVGKILRRELRRG